MNNDPERTRDRRVFLTSLGAAALGAPLARAASAQDGAAASRPAWTTAERIEGAAALAGLDFNKKEIEQMTPMVEGRAQTYEMLRSQKLQNGEGPAEVFRAARAQREARPMPPAAIPIPDAGACPANDEDIAFASILQLASWLRTGKLTSSRLTEIYLERLAKYNDLLKCVITLTPDLARQQAKAADAALEAARKDITKSLSPLCGIPYGLKDLFDTRGIATTWGAEPWRNRVPDSNATVVDLLQNAGAVLVAKLSLGALAYGDIWFGGTTKNPWNPRQGSSGSSAGSACAVAAGLVAFALGTETWGSIASPSARCGTTGFRPTFGLVPRTGAMALCWSLDKAGPIARTAADCEIVLQQIAAHDPADTGSVAHPYLYESGDSIVGMKIGYVEKEYERASAADRNLLETLKKLGARLEPVEIPDGPYAEIINLLITVEGAAAFDEMTRDNSDDLLKWQDAPAWPNTFRATRLVTAVEYLQARRVRGRFVNISEKLFRAVDALVAPSAHQHLHALTNMTGEPALTLRHGKVTNGRPVSATLWSAPFEDAKLLKLGRVLERELALWPLRPTMQ